MWLVDTVRQAKRVQFEEIADRWLSSPLNEDRSPLALRTFHNHRHAIESLFGIRIECDRSDHHHYYIYEEDGKNSTRLKVWMLQRLGYSDLEKDFLKLGDKVILDDLPEDKGGLYDIIHALQNDNVLIINLSEPLKSNKTSIFFAPHKVRFDGKKWLVTGNDIETGHNHEICLDNVRSATVTLATFYSPKGQAVNV